MNKLWSPWRSQYIDSFMDEHKGKDCIFCKLCKDNVDDPDNLLIDKGEFTFTMLNLYPYNNGHLMVVPYKHKNEFQLITDEENGEIMEKLQLAVKALKITMNAEGFNLGANFGKASGAGIDDHIHFHVVPRWNGDTNFMPVLGEVKIISEDLLLTKEKLLKAYSNIKQEISQSE